MYEKHTSIHAFVHFSYNSPIFIYFLSLCKFLACTLFNSLCSLHLKIFNFYFCFCLKEGGCALLCFHAFHCKLLLCIYTFKHTIQMTIVFRFSCIILIWIEIKNKRIVIFFLFYTKSSPSLFCMQDRDSVLLLL